METSDLDKIVDLLTLGYHIRNRDFWARRLERLAQYSQPPGFPKYGYLLDYNGSPIGSIFTIFSPMVGCATLKFRCYLGSWYVKPEFRSYAIMLAMRALKREDITYFNITPNTHVIPILEAQGYVRFCEGRFIAAPLFSRRMDDGEVEQISPAIRMDAVLPACEIELLEKHAAYGCISVTCSSRNEIHPFVFQPSLRLGTVRFVRLVYCRDLNDFVRFARPLGHFLIKHGFPLVSLDANGPIDGLVGKYSDRFPKYFKGPDQPRLGDLAYSTRVIFDF